MAKRKSRSQSRPKKSNSSQRTLQILGILIALSMILVLIAPLAGRTLSRSQPTATPEPTETPVPEEATSIAPTPTPGAAVAPTPVGGG